METNKNTPILIFSTAATYKESKFLAKILLKDKIAACVNIVPKTTSLYHWEGNIREDNEYMIIIKTLKINEIDVYSQLREHHSYEVPEIITVTLSNCDLKYHEWIKSIVSGN
ncbi:MAG: divalent-cation tolerance protein CutA [Candidatus Neomarinimicrobiota bacterium]